MFKQIMNTIVMLGKYGKIFVIQDNRSKESYMPRVSWKIGFKTLGVMNIVNNYFSGMIYLQFVQH